jgi:hypothetical protein
MIPQSIIDPAGRLVVSGGIGGESIAGNQSPATHRNDNAAPRGRLARPRPLCTAAQKTLMEPAAGSRTHDSIT